MRRETGSLEKQVEAFRASIAGEFPRSSPTVEWFPSGAFMFDLDVGEMRYTAEWGPSDNVFGINSHTPENDCGPFWCGYEHVFETFDELGGFIRDLLVANQQAKSEK